MTWKELAKKIKKIPEKDQEQQVVVYVPSLLDYYNVKDFDNTQYSPLSFPYPGKYYLEVYG